MIAKALPSAFSALALAGCAHSGDLASLAERDIGKTAREMRVPGSLWCADAVNKWRGEAGLSIVPSRLAADQVKKAFRLARPERGALMISARPGGNHVDVVLAVLPDGTVRTAGGNIGGIVAERIRPIHNARFVKPE